MAAFTILNWLMPPALVLLGFFGLNTLVAWSRIPCLRATFCDHGHIFVDCSQIKLPNTPAVAEDDMKNAFFKVALPKIEAQGSTLKGQMHVDSTGNAIGDVSLLCIPPVLVLAVSMFESRAAAGCRTYDCCRGVGI